MKRALIVAALAVLAITGSAAAAGRFSLTGGYALASNAKIGGAVRLGLGLDFEIARGLSVELGVAGLMSKTEDDPVGLSAGRLTLLPIEAGLRGRLPLGVKSALFAGAGVGLAVPLYSLDADLVKSWEAVGFALEEKLDPSLTASARLGFETAVSPGVALFLEASYRYCRAKGSWTISDTEGSEAAQGDISGLNLDSFGACLGLSFSFGR